VNIPRAIRALARAGLGLSLVLGLGACVSLLPKSKPAPLYRCGGGPVAAAQPASTVSTGPGVVLLGLGFPLAAGGDGILTMTGDQAAYIGESRWVSPASVLFQEAAERAFDRPGAGVRLLGRGDLGAATALLRLDVRDFQAVYDQGAGGAPQVVVSLQAYLTGIDGRLIDSRNFEVRKRAADNRVTAIVQAFNEATAEILTAVTGSVAQQVQTLPRLGSTATSTSAATSTTVSTTTVRPAP
jgi:cholesterol transport system auxiliary component